jgi:hypothetical protein
MEFQRLYGRSVIDILFYADDGMIAGEDPIELQKLLDLLTDKFAAVGLKMNADKTESKIMDGGEVSQPMSKESYYHQITGQGKSWKEKSKEKLSCSLCRSLVNRKNITQHQQMKKCIAGRKNFTPPQNTTQVQQEIELIHQPKSYVISVNGVDTTNCPVANCPYKTHKPIAMHTHVWNIHDDDWIVVEEEVQLPGCETCGIFQWNVGTQHKQSERCRRCTMIKQEPLESERNKI